MLVVINKENKQSIYKLTYDEEQIKKLINTVINLCSIRRKGRYIVQACSKKEAEEQINSTKTWNDINIYENVSDIVRETVNDPFDYWRPGDPSPYSFEAEALFVPELVTYLIDIINGENIDYDEFIARSELNRKQEIELKIQKLDLEINNISNFDTKRKIAKLEELATQVKFLNEVPNFDYDLLSKYYDIAESYMELELLQETVTYPKRRNLYKPEQ